MEAWRGTGDPRVASPIIYEGRRRLALQHSTGAERRAGARRRGRGYQRPPDSSSAMRRNALKNTRLGVRRKKAGAPKGPSLRPGSE